MVLQHIESNSTFENPPKHLKDQYYQVTHLFLKKLNPYELKLQLTFAQSNARNITTHEQLPSSSFAQHCLQFAYPCQIPMLNCKDMNQHTTLYYHHVCINMPTCSDNVKSKGYKHYTTSK